MNHVIRPSSDRKTRAYTSQQNTYGLLPGRYTWKNESMGTCPCATLGLGGCLNIKEGRKNPECYVFNTISAYSGVYPLLKDNTQLMRNNTQVVMADLLSLEFSRFKETELRRKAANKAFSLNYRLHWSGDIFNLDYAGAIRYAVLSHPDINFWCYTRSMFAVPILCNIPNLTLYISLDPQNFDEGMSTYVEYKEPKNKTLRLCYMSPTNDFAERLAQYAIKFAGQNVLRRLLGSKAKSEDLLRIKPVECPSDTGKLKELEGACHKCKQCIGEKDVCIWFKS